jgi:hypothetical protein
LNCKDTFSNVFGGEMKRKTVMYSIGDTALKGNTRWQHHMLERWVRNSSFTLHMGDAESSLKLLTERRHL